MNILISSALLALAITMVAMQLKEMVDNARHMKELGELVVASGVKKRRVSRRHAPADWDRILRETELKYKSSAHSITAEDATKNTPTL